VRIAFGNTTIFPNHCFTIFLRQVESCLERPGSIGRVLAFHVHAFKNAPNQARDNFWMIAIKIVTHGPDVGNQMIRRSGRHNQPGASFKPVGDIIDIRSPTNKCIVRIVLHKNLGR
jgi:hypothetical protein